MGALTLEQQREILWGREEAFRHINEMQNAEARARSGAQQWEASERLHEDWEHIRRRRTDTSGMVEQQRLFALLRTR